MFVNFIIHLDTLFRNVAPRDASIFAFDAIAQGSDESWAFGDVYKCAGELVFVPEIVAYDRIKYFAYTRLFGDD